MPWYKSMSTRWYNLQLTSPVNRKLIWSAIAGGTAILYLKIWLPVTNLAIPCVFHEVTGLYCPGCGITRSLLSLLELDIVQAFKFNPLWFFLVPLYTTYVLMSKAKLKRASQFTMTAILIGTIAFGILRNFPSMDWLAPIIEGVD